MQDAGTMLGRLGLSPAPSRPALARGAATTQAVIATGSAQEKANLAAADKLYAAFDAQDKGMAEIVTDDVVDRNQSAATDVVGKRWSAEFISGFWQMIRRQGRHAGDVGRGRLRRGIGTLPG